ncbi:glycosyltransferase [Photobacterium phosphoreum]|uniref:glycosyltransferase n=1 Tax=Photobacterium phosphoreum TaxID=659 RepID=UPI000D162158|nr:glycosyltransferase [Photobacterium phosphoreum]PTB31239.1 glycosyl transferase [Photobacterium phosphoreum]
MFDKVCVLLAAYNGEKYIREQLDSILSQVEVEVDIYISLDLSTDSSLDIIHEYMNVYPNIYLLNYGKRYGSAGQNFFRLLIDVDFSKYKYISFSDQDDIWLPSKIKRAIFLIKEKKIDAVSSNVTAFWNDERQILIKKNSKQVDYDFIFESSGPGCTFVMNYKLVLNIKKSLLNNKENINKLWLHDWYCYAFSRSNDYIWHIDHQSLLLYRQHENNQVGANNGFEQISRRVKTVLSGDAFDKVMSQAEFLSIKNKPILLLKKGDFWSLIKLALMAKKCRRKISDQMAFFIMIFIFSFKRLFCGK